MDCVISPCYLTAADQPDNAEEPVSFAILTANANERKAVRHFLKLGKPIDTTRFPYAEMHVLSEDLFLAEIEAKIKPHADKEENTYPLFDLEVGQKRLVGVHVSCDEIGPWGAFDKTVDLLVMAKDNGWKLRYIFLVGCCGAFVIDREECKRGTVLLARQIKDYLHTGKVQDGQVDGISLTQDMDTECLEGLKNAQVTADCRHPQKIQVEITPYLSGPLVIKDEQFAKSYCADTKITGVEMEVVGVVKAVNAFHRITGDPEQKVVLAKGVSDYTGKKGEEGSCILFGKETPPVNDDSLQVYATLQSLTLVIRFVAGNMRQLFSNTS